MMVVKQQDSGVWCNKRLVAPHLPTPPASAAWISGKLANRRNSWHHGRSKSMEALCPRLLRPQRFIISRSSFGLAVAATCRQSRRARRRPLSVPSLSRERRRRRISHWSPRKREKKVPGSLVFFFCFFFRGEPLSASERDRMPEAACFSNYYY